MHKHETGCIGGRDGILDGPARPHFARLPATAVEPWLCLPQTHLTLKTEATRPAAANVLQQQMRFDTFVHRYNQERPHQALDMATPASRYTPSPRLYRSLEELDYPFHDWTAVVTCCGRICYQRRKINLSQVFAGQKVGVKQRADHVWLVSFMDYDSGYFDDETCRLEPIENPFGPKLSPMSPE